MDPDCTLKVERPVFEQEELNKAYDYSKPRTTFISKLVARVKSCEPAKVVRQTIPAIEWLRHYRWRENFLSDVIAGGTVGIMHIPQGMAYALLGNVPPIVGIYMAFFPVLVYFFLGTSRHISMGTFAVVCLMTGKTVLTYGTINNQNSTDFNSNETFRLDGMHYTPIEVATAVTFLVGVYQLIMYIFRLGIICTLLSETLVNAFTTGAAIHVLTSQIKDLLGMHLTKFKGPFKLIYTYNEIFNNISSVNTATILVSAITLLVLVVNNEVLKPLVSRASKFPIPIELIAVVAGTLASYYMQLDATYHIIPVGAIPIGLPVPNVPSFSLMTSVAMDSLTITMVAYTISMSMALIFAQKLSYEVDSNQELLAQGAGNVVGSFFSCMPFTASLSRSLIQQTVGGRTQLASVVSCCILLVVLLWIGPYFEPLPRCILASIIVVALKGMLVQAKDLPKFWRLSKLDGVVWLATFTSVVLVDIDIGLLVGICLSLISILIQGMKPYTCLLGVVPDTDLYLDMNRYKGTLEIKGIKIFHYCGGLNFASRSHFRSEVYRLVDVYPQKVLSIRRKLAKKMIKNPLEEQNGVTNLSFIGEPNEPDASNKDTVTQTYSETKDKELGKTGVHCLILDFSALGYIDPSGVNTLRLLGEEFNKIDIPLYLAGSSCPVYENLQKCGLFGEMSSPFKIFPTVHDAVTFAQSTLMEDISNVRL